MKNISDRKRIDIENNNYGTLHTFKDGDDGVLRLALYKNGIGVNVETQTVRLGVKRADDTLVEMSSQDSFVKSNNNLDIILKNSIFTVKGKYEFDLQLTDSTGQMTSQSFFVDVKLKTLNAPVVEATNEFDIFNKTVNRIEKDYQGLRKVIIDENNAAYLQEEINKANASLETIAIQLDDYLQVPESDYSNAFVRANAKLINGGTILLGCKEYSYNDVITLSDNVSLICINGYSILKALNLEKSCLIFGSNSRLENFIMRSETTKRDSLDTSSKIHTKRANNVKMKNLIVDGANSAGMLLMGLTNFSIENCLVMNTRADGIHMTNGCKDGIVMFNTVENTGDDSIACVSYLEKGEQVENVKILNNNVKNSNARGITNIGSKNITIKNNNVNGTNYAGILVSREGSYNTYQPLNTKIVENNVVNFSKNSEHGAILLTGFDDEEGSLISGNSVDGTTEGTKRKGITIDGCSNVNITDNYLYNTSHCIRTGNYANPSSQKRLQNIKVNNNRTKKCTGPVFISTDFLDVSNNNFIETIADSGREMFVGKAKYGVFGNNTITNASGTKGILKFEDLFDSIVNFNNANVQYGFTSDKNPYNDSYEWGNKIMEGQGITIPQFDPTGGNRCGKFGTIALTLDGLALKVRVAQNTWKTINLT